MKELSQFQSTPFDAIRQIDKDGRESWSARDLHDLLGYSTWQRFQSAINRAMKSYKNSGGTDVEDQFNRSVKLIISGKGAQREIEDFLLTRNACYLIAMNADPDIPSVALAQAYFYTKIREGELGIAPQAQELDPIETAQNPQLLHQAVEQLEDIALAAAKKAQLFKLLEQHYYPSQYRPRGRRNLPQAKPVIWNRMQVTQMTIIFEIA